MPTTTAAKKAGSATTRKPAATTAEKGPVAKRTTSKKLTGESGTAPTRQQKAQTERDQDVKYRAILEATNADFGTIMNLMEGVQGRWSSDKVIRTGSLQLDMQTGIGGIPRGRVTQIYGAYSCGKTTLALHAAHECQKNGGVVVYIDGEYALDPIWVKKIGVDTKRFLVSQPETLNQALDLIRFLCALSQPPELIVLDSVPSLPHKAVLEGDAEHEQRRALQASLWSQWLPVLVRELKEANTALLLLNQTRQNQDTSPWAPDYLIPGGEALKFYSSVFIHVRRRIEGKSNTDGMDWQETIFSIDKNKVGSPFKKGSFRIYPKTPGGGGGIDRLEDIVSTAIEWGIVQSDTQYDGKPVSKKGWFTYALRPGDESALAADNERLDSMGENPYPKDTKAISVYRLGDFLAELEELPNLVDAIEDHILATLDESGAINSEDYAADVLDFDEDAIDDSLDENGR